MDAQTVAPPASDTRQAADAKASTRSRLWEIDALRGVAVVAMVFFHLMWDLQFFGLTDVDVFSPGWQTFACSIGTTFIFIMGVSLTLDASRNGDATDTRSLWWRNFKRGAIVFGFGMLVSLATFVIVNDAFVRFGILHLIGASIMLAYPFLRARPSASAMAGLIVVVVGAYVQTVRAPFPWLIPFGVVQTGVNMVDYYPLAPWLGVALLGIAAGKTFYPQGTRRFGLPDLGMLAAVRGLRLLGRHSLVIYLLHQPILIALLLGARFLRLV